MTMREKTETGTRSEGIPERKTCGGFGSWAKHATLRFLFVACCVVYLYQFWHHSPVPEQLSVHERRPSIAADIYPDTDYPLRPATEPWDIASSVPYPRVLAKTVSEGTWLRISPHPTRDEIVFDMLGDLYCMSSKPHPDGGPAKARAILRGIAFDKEAEFSPDGTQLVYISDAGFGVDNVWTLPYSNCDDMAAAAEADDDTENCAVRDTAVQQTNSTFRFFSSPSFHPTEPKLLATKWFLTGRPNGAGEVWELPLLRQTAAPGTLPQHGGRRLVARLLPPSWPASRYFESQLGAEQARYTPDGKAVVFTRNANKGDAAAGTFSYSKDVHAGINAVFLYNTTTGATETIVAAAASAPNKPASPGGASMPRLSHDGHSLAFVRRVDDRSVLAIKDLRSGTVHYVWDGLDYDVSTIPAFMGAYPNYGFRGDDSGIIIWSRGQIWAVPLMTDALGERVAAGPPQHLPFGADVRLRLANTRFNEIDALPSELAPAVRVHGLSGLRSNTAGTAVVVEAAGDNYVFDLETQQGSFLSKPTADNGNNKNSTMADVSCYAPSFVVGTDWLLQACWDDHRFSTLYLTKSPISTDDPVVIMLAGISLGRYVSPVADASTGRIAFVRTGGDYMTGDFVATRGQGVWVGRLPPVVGDEDQVTVTDLHLVDTPPSSQETKLVLSGAVLLIHNPTSSIAYDLKTGKQTILATGKTSVEMASSGTGGLSHIAFRDFQHAWMYPFSPTLQHEAIWSKPGDTRTPPGLVRLSADDGGHDVAFSGDGTRVFWLLGSTLYTAEIDAVTRLCRTAPLHARDQGVCAQPAVSAVSLHITSPSALDQHRAESGDAPLVLLNATLISMAPGGMPVVPNATIIIQGGVFIAVGHGSDVPLPDRSSDESPPAVFDLAGGAVLPGFIDFHGHWGGFLSGFPVTSWEMALFLAYGITTVHNPASRNVAGTAERNRVEKGRMWGPRVFHTGDVLYGSTQPSVYTEIHSRADARAALRRVQVEGGDSAFTIKNYQLVPRSARQRLLLEAGLMASSDNSTCGRNGTGMLVVPEGGWSLDWDLTYFIDGYTTLEHPLPVATLYDDVLSLIEASGSSYTPLAVMNYGGIFGQHWFHQSAQPRLPEDPKLRRFLPHAILEALTEVKQAPPSSYHVFNTTRSTRRLRSRGVRTNIGAHGEQPIGYLYHSEMDMMRFGYDDDEQDEETSAYEVLRSATYGNAVSLGLGAALGSVEVGKLADLVVYPAGVADIESVWEHKRDMKWVVTRGKILATSAMDGLVEVWPIAGRRQSMGRMNAEDE